VASASASQADRGISEHHHAIPASGQLGSKISIELGFYPEQSLHQGLVLGVEPHELCSLLLKNQMIFEESRNLLDS
jgi:hypothetical protein